jgi:hypothetical protein
MAACACFSLRDALRFARAPLGARAKSFVFKV